MKEPLIVRAMAAMDKGIETARKNPLKDGDPMPDNYISWCVWNALRLAGFKIIESEPENSN